MFCINWPCHHLQSRSVLIVDKPSTRPQQSDGNGFHCAQQSPAIKSDKGSLQAVHSNAKMTKIRYSIHTL